MQPLPEVWQPHSTTNTISSAPQRNIGTSNDTTNDSLSRYVGFPPYTTDNLPFVPTKSVSFPDLEDDSVSQSAVNSSFNIRNNHPESLVSMFRLIERHFSDIPTKGNSFAYGVQTNVWGTDFFRSIVESGVSMSFVGLSYSDAID